jgi:hypothetical protein
MGKSLAGHHLMRVRIRKNIFDKMKEVAEEESDRTGESVTVSDLVRSACYNYLLVNESCRQLEAMSGLSEDAVIIVRQPML